MNFLTQPVMYGLGAVAIAAGLFAGVQTVRLAHERAEHAKAETKLAEYRAETDRQIARFEVEARATEQRHSADLNRIARENLQQSQEASDAAYARAIADARAGKLRNVWTCPVTPTARVPSVAAGPGKPDEGADDRAEAIGRVLRIAAECDAQVRGLQAVTESDRKVMP